MIKITTDSTCDLGEQVEKRGIAVMPLNVILGTDCYRGHCGRNTLGVLFITC